MGRLRKIRVAAPDRATSVAMVQAEVAAAVGHFPRADLQEIEGDEVVVELALVPVAGQPATPSDLRRELARRCPALDVLSAWDEEEDVRPGAPARARWQLHDSDGDVAGFPVAVRAMLDGVPSAEWRPKEGCWTLGVPCTVDGGRRAVAVARRRGYTSRFPVPPPAAWRTDGTAVPA